MHAVMPEWVPSTAERRDTVTVAAATAMHELLDTGGNAPQLGDPLPLLWHWLAFLPQARQSEIGPDGHPVTGTFLPPTGGRQRMYAGGHVSMTKALRIGDPLVRKSMVTGIEHKTGRSGDLIFVTVEHVITSARGEVSDRNDIVYKDPGPPLATRADGGVNDGSEWEGGRTVAIDSTLLFRFSALTYNAHRIHYDRDYATKSEGYPGLVVHGPLQAVLLADAASGAAPGMRLSSFNFRSTAPAFDNAPLELGFRRSGSSDAVELAAFSNGKQTMTATAVLAPETRRT